MTLRTNFLDTHFDVWSREEVQRWLTSRDTDSRFAYVVTPNVDHMVRLAKSDKEVRLAYAEADLSICDSRILLGLGRTLGVHLSAVPGSDIVADLFELLLHDGDRVCLIGGSDDHAVALQQRFPRLVVLQHVPPMGLRHDRTARLAAIEFAAQAAARVTLLAVGSPQQELIAREMAADGRVRGTALCVGAAVGFLIGAQTRAPRFLQRVGLEWSWRLISQPRRMARRYLIDGPMIVPIALRWWWSK